jgi:hypothetical protein
MCSDYLHLTAIRFFDDDSNARLPKDMRAKLMQKVSLLADKYGLKFGTCRESLSCLNTATCDGSWLLNERSSKLV